MEITVQKVLLTNSSLRLGVVVRFGERQGVRFGTVDLPLESVPWEALWLAIARLDDAPAEYYEDVPLFDEPSSADASSG